MEQQSLTVDHVTYITPLIEGETTNERLWVIARQKPMDDYQYQQALILAQYWYNINKYDCQYNIGIHKKLALIGFT
jgi:hypothetical protein